MSEVLTLLGVMFVDSIYSCRPRDRALYKLCSWVHKGEWVVLSSQLVVCMPEVLTLVGVMFVDGIYSCRPLTISTLGTVPCINSVREFRRVHCSSAKLWLILTPSLICLVKGSRNNFMGSKQYSAFSPSCSIWSCLYRAFPSCFTWWAFACSFSLVYSVLPVSPWYTDFFCFLSSQVVHWWCTLLLLALLLDKILSLWLSTTAYWAICLPTFVCFCCWFLAQDSFNGYPALFHNLGFNSAVALLFNLCCDVSPHLSQCSFRGSRTEYWERVVRISLVTLCVPRLLLHLFVLSPFYSFPFLLSVEWSLSRSVLL